MRLSNTIISLAAGAALFCSAGAQADGLSDLKAALNRLQGQTPLKATLEIHRMSRQGEGKELEENQGKASVSLEDGARGLQVLYARDLLQRAEAEEKAKEKDAKAKTPTLSALKDISAGELRPMISAASHLARKMEKAIFKGEKAQDYNGKPARLLTFEVPLDSIPQKDRKYIKKFEGSLDIWIAADGTPLASHSKDNVSGRAFVVISFESKSEDQSVYSVAGERLITLRKDSKSSGSGAGEKGESHTVKTLNLQS
ncbi:MAG: hypothetical protein RL748_157 [Pseudomonadota bacterium]